MILKKQLSLWINFKVIWVKLKDVPSVAESTALLEGKTIHKCTVKKKKSR